MTSEVPGIEIKVAKVKYAFIARVADVMAVEGKRRLMVGALTVGIGSAGRLTETGGSGGSGKCGIWWKQRSAEY
jgi:hypothetical protein